MKTVLGIVVLVLIIGGALIATGVVKSPVNLDDLTNPATPVSTTVPVMKCGNADDGTAAKCDSGKAEAKVAG